MEISKVLNHQLAKPSHIVKIEDKVNELRLKKDSAVMRYSFSQDDILSQYGTIESFLDALKNQGFENTTFLFQRTYGTPQKTTYHTMKEVTVNLQNNQGLPPTMATTPNYPPVNQAPSFLASPMDQNVQFLGAMVQSERAGDYLKRINELEEDVRDYRSKVRRLEDDNHSLKIKVYTAEERAELKIQTELLNKRSVFESDGFQKISEGLGALIPHVFPALIAKGQPPAQLGAPDVELSPIKKQAVAMVQGSSDEDVALVAYILQNKSDQLVTVIQNFIQNNS